MGSLALMTTITFISPLASSAFSPAVSYVAVDLHEYNQTVLSLSVSIFLLGYTVSRPVKILSPACRFHLLSPGLTDI
jgi:MFS family permease